MMISANKDYRTILLEELESRCQRNYRYSLRAFAKFLGLSSARLSEIMNRKSGLSRDAAANIAKRLEFNKSQTEYFCDLVEAEHARSPVKRKFAKLKLQKYETAGYRQLQEDAFAVIADWYCFAILELAKLDEFESNAEWIAQALGITPQEARAAIERMERLKLIEFKNGKYRPTGDFSVIPGDVPSDSVKRFHKAILEKTIPSLQSQPIQKRDYSAMILSIDSSQIAQAKEMLRDFRREFDRKMGAAEQKDRVYCLSMQFFNLAPALEEMK